MALIGNRSVLNKSPGRFLNAGVATFRSEFNKHGMQRSAAFSPLSAMPNGHLAPSAWVLPRTAGGMSSINFTTAKVEGLGLAVGGITTTGTSSITLTFADAAGQLIASGGGAATADVLVQEYQHEIDEEHYEGFHERPAHREQYEDPGALLVEDTVEAVDAVPYELCHHDDGHHGGPATGA